MTTDTAIHVDVDNGITVVTFGSQLEHLDDHAVMLHQEELLATADTADPPRVLFDLTQVALFGSTFIEVIFRVWNRLNKQDGNQFAICGLSPYCLEVLQITHLDQLWPIHESRSEAISQMTSP